MKKIYIVEFEYYEMENNIRYFSTLEKAKDFIMKEIKIYLSLFPVMKDYIDPKITDMGIRDFMIIHPINIDDNSNVKWED